LLNSGTNEEKELLMRIAAGDEAAFTALFDAYKDKIYSIAMRLTRNAAVAEEIVQDVFLKIWLKRQGLAEVEHFRAYLFTATRNEVISAIRRLARRRVLVAGAAKAGLTEVNDTDSLLLDREYQAILRQAVEQLPPQQQKVYRLMKEQGLRRDQAAEQLGMSPETVKMHLALAMRSVRAFCIARLDLYIAVALFEALYH
jgi:RNA polymerase sigma-70 factor (family 1)